MLDPNIKTHLINLVESEKKESESYFSYLRHLSTVSIGFLGLLVGLKPETLPNFYSKLFFFITIVLLCVGILLLVICLFQENIQHRQEITVRKKQLLDYLDAEKKESVQIDQLPSGNLKILEIITFSILSLSIFSLIIYVFYSTV